MLLIDDQNNLLEIDADNEPSKDKTDDSVFAPSDPFDFRAIIQGGSGNEFIDGTEFDDIIYGGAGNDQIDALGGNDVVYGDAGDDILFGGLGNDHLYGHNLSDTSSGNDILNGGAGDDFLYYTYAGSGPNNVDQFNGGDGIDTFLITSSQAGGIYREVSLVTNLFTWDGNTRGVLSGIENVTVASAILVEGNDFDNVITGTGNASNTFYGRGGNDLIFGGAGIDSLYGGDGYDTVAYTSSTSGVIIDLAEVVSVDGFGTYDSLYDFEAVLGSEHNDILYGNADSNALGGSGGDDFLDGRGGADILLGGAGNDTYVINTLGDTVTEAAGEGTDVVYAYTAHTLNANVEIGVNLQTNTTASLSGNSGDNTLIMSSTASGNAMDGEAGNDLMYAQSNTVMYGGLGNDTLVLQGFGNYAEGNEGDDVFIDVGTSSTIVEYANAGTDTLYSYAMSTTLSDNVEILVLINSAASGVSGTGNDAFNTIIGSAGANILSGAGGGDFILGGGGADFIAGGTGVDVLQGNSGADTFYYDGLADAGDVIQDWIAAEDSFAFASAPFGFTAGQSLTDGVNFFSSSTPFATSAQASFLWDSDDTILYYDADGSGSGVAILVADLQAFTDVTVDDFVFI